MLAHNKVRSIAIATSTCVVVFILASYWWLTTHEHSVLLSLPAALCPTTSPATSPITSPTTSLAHADAFSVVDKLAVIVETRPLRTLIPLITHFAAVLGPEWPILFFTRRSTLRTLEAFGQGSLPFKRMVKSGQVKIIELPTQASLQNYYGISDFLASEWFWMRLEPAKHMLLFQTDSILCANSGRQLEDFFSYDFVGAAHPFVPGAFNGGLSLRNVTLSRQVVSMSNIADDVVNGTGYGAVEDVWFWDKMKDLGGRFPSQQQAGEFAVDFLWAERPMGYHGVNKSVHENRLEEIFAWCPEAALAAASDELLELNKEEEASMPTGEDVESAGGGLLSFG